MAYGTIKTYIKIHVQNSDVINSIRARVQDIFTQRKFMQNVAYACVSCASHRGS